MSKPITLQHKDYIVGWICPLEPEQIAAHCMLDKVHQRLPQDPVDHNVYTLGSINGYNVVIAGLTTKGNTSAATVVTQMRNTFQSLRFCLIVGVGGGVPVKTSEGPIRLGHVVVSKPERNHFGVLMYHWRNTEAVSINRTGSLEPTPRVLFHAAQDLAEKRPLANYDPLKAHLKRIDSNKRGLRKFKFPGRENDRLYKPEYLHAHPGRSCLECKCDPRRLVLRPYEDEEEEEDGDEYIVVHRGTIASGEVVMADGLKRDKVAKQLGALCFEMEAAGAMCDFGCLVIRGISNYADSHKNDQWHGYAAATAAAYARQLFFHMPVQEIKSR